MRPHLTSQLHEVVWLMDRFADRWLKDHHAISFAQFYLLISLQSVAPISQRGLAQHLFYSDAAVSRMVKLLPEYIHVTSTRGRTRMLSLTPKGLKLVQACAQPLEKKFCEMVERGGVNVEQYAAATAKIRKILLAVPCN